MIQASFQGGRLTDEKGQTRRLVSVELRKPAWVRSADSQTRSIRTINASPAKQVILPHSQLIAKTLVRVRLG